MSLRKWFACSIVAKALDVLTTSYIVVRDGLGAESNPFAADMLSTYGIVPGLILNWIIVSALLCILYKYRRKKLLTVSSALLAVIAIVNLITIFVW